MRAAAGSASSSTARRCSPEARGRAKRNPPLCAGERPGRGDHRPADRHVLQHGIAPMSGSSATASPADRKGELQLIDASASGRRCARAAAGVHKDCDITATRSGRIGRVGARTAAPGRLQLRGLRSRPPSEAGMSLAGQVRTRSRRTLRCWQKPERPYNKKIFETLSGRPLSVRPLDTKPMNPDQTGRHSGQVNVGGSHDTDHHRL